MDKAFEMDQIRRTIDAIMNHFERYKIECDNHWPLCPFHGSEMCQVIQKDHDTYFQCFEFDDEGKCCGHKEWSI